MLVEVAAGRFQFAHALVRSALYNDISATRRALRHRKVAQAIEQRSTDASTGALAALAHHYAEAGAPDDRRRALSYARAAGLAALEQLAHESAIRFFRQAITLLDGLEHEPGDEALRCDLLTALGKTMFDSGDPSNAEVLDEAAALAERLRDGVRLGEVVLASDRGASSISGTVDPERVRRLEVALGLLPADDSPLRARLLAALSSEVHFAGEPQRMTALADEAIGMAHRIGDARTLGFVLMHRASTFRLAEHLEERLVATAELQRLGHQLGDPVLEFNGTFRRVEAGIEAGDVRDLDESLATIIRLADQLQQPSIVRTAWRVRADIHLMRGELDRCEHALFEMWERAEAAGLADATVTTFTGVLHNMRSLQGRAGETLPWWERCIEYREVAGFRLGWAISAVDVDPVQSMAIFDEYAATGFSTIRPDLTWRATMTFVAKLCLAHDRLEHAPLIIDLLRPFEHQVVDSGSGIKGSVGLSIGRLLVALDRLDEAEVALQRAAVVHRRLGAVLLTASTDLALAELRLRRGDADARAAAATLLDGAIETAERCGAAGLADEGAALREGAMR